MEPVAALRALGLVLPWQRSLVLIPGVALPAAATGALFPAAARASLQGVQGVGSGVGALSALSTVGGIFGSLVSGFILMPLTGAVPALAAFGGIALLGALAAATAFGEAPPRRAAAGAGLTVLATAGLIALVRAEAALILFPGERLVAFTEGRNSSTAIVDHPSGRRFMLVGGERLLGGGSDVDLALQLHPGIRDVTVIGVGTGSVARAALSHPEVRSVTAVDVDGDIPRFFPLMLGAKADAMAPPRFRFLEDDGRHHLRTSGQAVDLLVNDAAIYAWYLELSTLEFNRLARSRLRQGGLYVGRLHLWRITPQALADELRTFLEVFPDATLWHLSDDIGMLIGTADGELLTDRLPKGANGRPARLWFDNAELRAAAEKGRIITDDRPLHVADIFLQRDLYPIVEYTAPPELPEGQHGPPR
jgi:spermidine synthase